MTSHSESGSGASSKSLSKILKELQALKQWKEEAMREKEKELHEKEKLMAKLEKEVKLMQLKKELKRERKNRGSEVSSSYDSVSLQESQHIGEHYQPPPHRRSHRSKEKEVRVDLPFFHGKEDIDAYLDWEMKVEQLFACHRVSEERRVPLATLSFQGQAMHWWTAQERERRIHNDPPIQYWNELKSALRRRHIPSYYERELMDKLQRLQQKHLSVEEYRQRMELYMMRAGIREEERITISRYMSGLNLEIRDRVELLPYRDFNDLVQLCLRVEQQILRKKQFHSNSYSKKESKREGDPSREQPQPHQEKEKLKEKEKGKVRDPSNTRTKTSDIKCFKCLGRGHIASQCPTKKIMILKGQDIYSSEEEVTSNSSSNGSDKESEAHEEAYPYEGELLMVRRLLGSQPSQEHLTQRENIFHTRCNIENKACSLIVDSGSCCNYCSTRLVEKLSLTTSPHPKPYKLHWLNEDGGLVVNQQVKVKFSIGNYKDKVLCDVVPMEACHILLGRPWQFDKKSIHNGLTNEINLTHKEKKFVLHPLTPQQVIEDQAQMKIEKETRKTKKKEEQSSQEIVKKKSLTTFKNIKLALYLQQSPLNTLEKSVTPYSWVEKFKHVSLPYASILASSNIFKNHELEYHASRIGVEVVLLKDGFPIASLKLNHLGTTFNYSSYFYKMLLLAFHSWGQDFVPKNALTYSGPSSLVLPRRQEVNYIVIPIIIPFEQSINVSLSLDLIFDADLYEGQDLRANPFQEGGNDATLPRGCILKEPKGMG